MKHRTLYDNNVSKRLESYIVVKVLRKDTNTVKDLPKINGIPTIFFMKEDRELLDSVIGYYDVPGFISFLNDIE